MDRSFRTLVSRPSAFLPLAMSFAALALIGIAYLIGLATGHGGLVRERDEGLPPTCGNCSWRDRCQYLHSSRSSGCQERRGRRSGFLSGCDGPGFSHL
jgi:hypothetical protein